LNGTYQPDRRPEIVAYDEASVENLGVCSVSPPEAVGITPVVSIAGDELAEAFNYPAAVIRMNGILPPSA
jgi:hypothetical protein